MAANPAASPKSEVVEFIPNQPQLVAVKFPRPKIIQGQYGERAMYGLTDGRVMFLDMGVAEKITTAAVKAGEPFWICLKWDGRRGSPRTWEVWLDPNAEKQRAVAENPGYVPKSPAVDPFAAARPGIDRARQRMFGEQPDGTFAVPAPQASEPEPESDLAYELRMSAEIERIRKSVYDKRAAASVSSQPAAQLKPAPASLGQPQQIAIGNSTAWADAIRERTQSNLTLYWELCDWAKSQFPGITKREVAVMLMNSLIACERGGRR